MADGYEYDEDFEEEEIWAVTADVKETSTRTSRRAKDPFRHTSSCSSSSSSSSSNNRRTTGGTALSVPICSSSNNVATKSAPVSIPERSKNYNNVDRAQGLGDYNRQVCTDVYKDDEDEGDDARAPPHEWLAKKMERSQISSSSVCQGAGRTLKGRDLTKVRNAVLSKTGFLEL